MCGRRRYPADAHVRDGDRSARQATTATFRMAALNAFDPYVFPFVGVTAALAQLENQEKSLGRPDSSEGAPTLAHSRPDYCRTRSSALMYEIKMRGARRALRSHLPAAARPRTMARR